MTSLYFGYTLCVLVVRQDRTKWVLSRVVSARETTKLMVMSKEEEEAYSKMEEEIKKELLEGDNIQTKPLPWMMFCTELNTYTIKPKGDEVPGGTVSEVVQKKGGVAFNVEYKSTVPKLPPINAKRIRVTAEGEDYEKWKNERDKVLVDKQEKAKIRRERIIQQKKLSAQRPRTARSKDNTETTPKD